MTDDVLQDATGNDNPTVAYNLSAINDWGSASPFLDLMRTMRTWMGHYTTSWGAYSTEDLIALGIFDENGWPTEIPDGLQGIGTIWDWSNSSVDSTIAEERAGIYVLRYEGEGYIRLKQDATVISRSDGEIVFSSTGGTFELVITSTDPDDTGDYIRNITIVKQEYVDLFDAGAVFNPDWLDLIDDARQLRFMDWMSTNNSTVTSWDEMPSADERGLTTMASVEIMVQLANEVGADPWFTIPAEADDDFVAQFAAYVRDNLDPDLVAYVEYSNEAWNGSFDQYSWLAEQSLAEWGTTSVAGYYLKRSTEVALIWEDVFGDEADSRVVNVLGTQTVNTGLTAALLSGVAWSKYAPDEAIDPTTVFEQLAITSYFGGGSTSNTALRSDLLAAIEDSDVDAMTWLHDNLLDPDYLYSLTYMASYWEDQAALAHQYGMDLVAYEGGQHVHSGFSTSGLTTDQVTELRAFLIEFVRSDEMADLYQELWDIWSEIADGPFMQYTEASVPGRSGSWGLYLSLLDENPRAELIEELNQISDPWWDAATAGDQYLQGLVVSGSDDDDILAGTVQEDYLTGGEGDDFFIPGAGNDGINGGEGNDTVELAGAFSDYTITADGDGYLVEGPDGLDYIFNVEFLQFEDGSVYDIRADTLSTPVGVLDLSDQTEALYITGINQYSTLGRELGLSQDDAYFAGVSGATAEVDGTEFEASYWTVQENILSSGGATISDTALETANLLGSVSTDITEIRGGSSRDRIYGRGEDEHFIGNAGNDYLSGGAGNDLLEGGTGRDTLVGGAGDDTLVGGVEHDVLTGGTGDDLITAGDGPDLLVFAADSGNDTITDFTSEDVLSFHDFFDDVEDIDAAISETEAGDLYVTNGQASITFEGLTLADKDWVFSELVG